MNKLTRKIEPEINKAVIIETKIKIVVEKLLQDLKKLTILQGNIKYGLFLISFDSFKFETTIPF